MITHQLWTDDAGVRTILGYVRSLRALWQVKPTPGHKTELSCEMFGEFHALLYQQLVWTPEFHDSWLSLRMNEGMANQEIVQGLLREIDERLLGGEPTRGNS